MSQPTTTLGTLRRGLSRPRFFLPTSLMDEAVRRLRIAALIFAIFDLAGTIAQYLYCLWSHRPVDWSLEGPPHFFILGLSVLLFGVTRSGLINSRNAIRLGRLYLITICFVVSYQEWAPGQSPFEWTNLSSDMSGWYAAGPSWVAVIVLSFTLILPSKPKDSLLTSLLATSTSPLALAICWHAYTQPPRSSELLIFFLLQYSVCLMAWMQSFVFLRFVREVDVQSEIGPYTLEKKLGEGGMGQVWKARHGLLARHAAIKLIRPEALGGTTAQRDEVTARFLREARSTATLTSPHTVSLYDYGRTEEGHLFSVTELLEGMDLAALLEHHGALPPARVIYILRQACLSLEEAHEAGLVHRDIKPGNLFLGRMGTQWDFVKVLDFGLVFLAPSARLDDDQRKLTAANEVHGTVDFMAPEQIQGIEVDGQADVYALGCLGYSLLTGETVFDGPLMVVLSAHLTRAPVAPSQRVGKSFPYDLEQLLLQCLEKDKKHRPKGARGLRLELEKLQASHPWSQDDARAWWGAHSHLKP